MNAGWAKAEALLLVTSSTWPCCGQSEWCWNALNRISMRAVLGCKHKTKFSMLISSDAEHVTEDSCTHRAFAISCWLPAKFCTSCLQVASVRPAP